MVTGTEYYIREFCVARDLQGRGIGRDFLERIEGFISRRGVRAIILSTDTDAPRTPFTARMGSPS
jgi:aminoglycoside 6'-N-acetyltransferase I